MGSKLRIVYMGTPEFAVAGLSELVEKGYNVVAVVTMPDKPAGRGHRLQFSPVKEYALAHGLPVLQPERLKDAAFVEELRAYHADLQVVTAFRMLPEIVWNMPRLGTFNVHGSLLPNYRGAAPINWAVINGEKETGLTTFMLKHEIDTGNIILQMRTPIGETEDVGSLHDRLMEMSKKMVIDTMQLIEKYDGMGLPVPTYPQDESLPMCPAPKIFKETCQIRFDQSAAAICHFVRGLSPYPGAWTDELPWAKGQAVKVFRAVPTSLSEQKGHIIIPCADGYVDLLELQLPGKKRMDAKSLLNGLH